MPELTPQDDFIHKTGTEPNWREAYYFDFFDPMSRLSAFGYAGVHPNQQIGDVIFALWRDDVLLEKFTRWDFNIPRDIGAERMGFGPLLFRPVAPFKTWELFYDDGFCRLDLAFTAIHPPYSWSQSNDAMAKTGSQHYEQQGRYRGAVRVGTETFQVQAQGARDHAWGWGARAKIRRWAWVSAQFSERFAFNSTQLMLEDGNEILYGYVFRGKTNDLVQRSRTRSVYAPRGQSPASVSLEMEAASGDRLAATGRILNAFNTSHQERNAQGHRFFCAAEFSSEGQPGHGQYNLFWRKPEDRPEEWTIPRGSAPSIDDTRG
jgi:hypothetical protein